MALLSYERTGYPRTSHASLVVQEPPPPAPRPPKLLDRVWEANRLRHGSRTTEKSYVGSIRRYILFHGKRHPAKMGAAEVTTFLSSLAVQGKVAASTQNQALSALLFLYRHVLHQDLPWLDDVVRARRPKRLPVVLTRTRYAPSPPNCTARPGSWPPCSMAPACACSNAAGCGSRTWTSG